MIPSGEIAQAAFRDDEFDALVDAYGIDEVLIGFRALAADLNEQLRIGGTPEWKRRAGKLSARVNARITVLRADVSARNREETATVDAAMAKWGGFAQRLATEIELLDPNLLHTIPGPKDSHITAAEWLRIRREHQAAKQATADLLMNGDTL